MLRRAGIYRYIHVMKKAVHALFVNSRTRSNGCCSGTKTPIPSPVISYIKTYQQLHRISKIRLLKRFVFYARTRKASRQQEQAVLNNVGFVLSSPASTDTHTGRKVFTASPYTLVRMLRVCIKYMQHSMQHTRMQQKHALLARHMHLQNRIRAVYLRRWSLQCR